MGVGIVGFIIRYATRAQHAACKGRLFDVHGMDGIISRILHSLARERGCSTGMLYQTEPAAGASLALSILDWVLFLLQIGLLLGGIYLAFVRRDTKALRRNLVRRFGYYALGLGFVGLLLGAATISNTGVFAAPFWLYGIAAIELGVLGYALYVWRIQYPKLLSSAAASRSTAASRPKPAAAPAKKPSPPPATSGSTPAEPPPEPARTERRGSRRDRKRKAK